MCLYSKVPRAHRAWSFGTSILCFFQGSIMLLLCSDLCSFCGRIMLFMPRLVSHLRVARADHLGKPLGELPQRW